MRRIVILGGGTGGTLTANRLRRALRPTEAEITVVDADDRHVYQPGLLFVPFGDAEPERLVRSRRRHLADGVRFLLGAVERVDLDERVVELADGGRLPYDVLVVASGARLVPEETPGLLGEAWGRTVHTFYDLDGAVALRDALARFDGGRLVVDVADLPVKCPVAPLEFCFLADAFFRERQIRDRVRITYCTPLDGAFTKPAAAAELGRLLQDKGIELVTEFNLGDVDTEARVLRSYDGREVPYDLAVVVPLHAGAAYVERSDGLGDALGFVPTNAATLQSLVRPEVFAIGDATDLKASKAGSVAHFEGETLVTNVERFLRGLPLEQGFDGHANCFVETGDGKAVLIDFNDTTEPLPGHFPGRIGLPLLHESRLNHLGKRAFSWIYWHVLLPGRSIPGVPDRMPTAGKHLPPEPLEVVS